MSRPGASVPDRRSKGALAAFGAVFAAGYLLVVGIGGAAAASQRLATVAQGSTGRVTATASVSPASVAADGSSAVTVSVKVSNADGTPDGLAQIALGKGPEKRVGGKPTGSGPFISTSDPTNPTGITSAYGVEKTGTDGVATFAVTDSRPGVVELRADLIKRIQLPLPVQCDGDMALPGCQVPVFKLHYYEIATIGATFKPERSRSLSSALRQQRSAHARTFSSTRSTSTKSRAGQPF